MELLENRKNMNYVQEIPNYFNSFEHSSNFSQDFTQFPEENIYNNNNFINTPFLNIEPDITFTVTFSTGGSFTFSDNPNNLFQTTFDKFFQEHKNLEHYKKKIITVLYEGNTVDFNQTLSENNIKEDSNILFILYIQEEKQISQTYYKGEGFSYYGYISKDGKDKNGKHKINQDLPIIILNIGKIKGFNLFGVLDGHGEHGHLVSQFCKGYFTRRMDEFAYQCKLENINTPEGIYDKLSLTNFQFIIDSFKNADIEMSKQNLFDYNYSGTTCNLVIQLNRYLICANVGDSRAILIYDNDTNTNQGIYLFSEDHLPEFPQEYQRIISSGGMVDKMIDQFGNKLGAFRVYRFGENPTYMGLGLSRALGDLATKSYGVISEPQIKEYKINHNTKFLVVCSDGIWKCFSNEAVRNLGNVYYQTKDIRSFCLKLMVDSCIKWKQSTRRDDITIVCVFF